MKKLDLTRLHNVALGKNSGRGCGKTVLVCMELIGLSELFDYRYKTITIYSTFFRDCLHIRETLINCCKAVEVDYVVLRDGVKINETTFMFTNMIENTCNFDTIYSNE